MAGTFVAVNAAADRVVEVSPLEDPRWAGLVAGRRDATVFHHPAWLRALHEEYGRPVWGLGCEDADGALQAGMPLMWTRGIPLLPRGVAGRRLASLPRTPLAGPIGAPDARAALLTAAAHRAREQRGARLQVKVRAPVPGCDLAQHSWRETFVVELPEQEGDLRFGSSRNHARLRWAVGKAASEGLGVRLADGLEDVRAWYPLHLETLRVHGVPPRPRRLFESMWRSMAPDGLLRLYLAERRGRLVAGSVVLAHGDTAFYAFNGVRRDALALRPNDAIQWRVIHDAVRDGRRRYDLGEVSEHQAGLADFKRKWGARPERLVRIYHPAPPGPPDPGASGRLHAARVTAWRRLPLRLTAGLGDLGYRFL